MAKLVAITQTVSQRKRRSQNSAAFNRALTKCKSQISHTKVTDIIKRKVGLDVSIVQALSCYHWWKCFLFVQRADRKTCSHVIRVHMNLFDFAEDDIIIAQVHLDSATIKSLILRCADSVPESLTRCLQKQTKSVILITKRSRFCFCSEN